MHVNITARGGKCNIFTLFKLIKANKTGRTRGTISGRTDGASVKIPPVRPRRRWLKAKGTVSALKAYIGVVVQLIGWIILN